MTHSVQTSFFSSARLYDKRYYPGISTTVAAPSSVARAKLVPLGVRIAEGVNLYQVIINTECGESHEFEIEADDFSGATRIAESFANNLMEDITYIEVYNQEYL